MDKLPWTGTEEADRLLANDPLALLIGMLLDQQFPMERAFYGPFLLQERMGTTLDAQEIADYDPETMAEIFKGPPAIHRFPASMAGRTQDMCRHVAENYDGNASRIWETARSGDELLKRLEALPGFGKAKSRIFVGVVGKRLEVGPPGWEEVAADWASIADVAAYEDIPALRAAKRAARKK